MMMRFVCLFVFCYFVLGCHGLAMEDYMKVLQVPEACSAISDCFTALTSGSAVQASDCLFPQCPYGFQLVRRYDNSGGDPLDGTQSLMCERAYPYGDGTSQYGDLTSGVDDLREREPFETLDDCALEAGPSVANYCLGRFLEANRICMDLTARVLYRPS